ncbi:MAG: zinc dependent phospholipase C family protein [Desulfobacterota bacterium]|nr:zinc dependent phospholipase C family protein [Thermodesulfobacteriota bacterium]
MPACIAHLLICNKAVKVLQEGDEYESFIALLDADQHKPFLNLGAIGPDLSYFGTEWKGLQNLLLEGSDKPLGVDGWSYLLHSKDPNRFPLALIELIWKDTRWEEEEWEGVDLDKFAFTCGYLSHMAADQIIHRRVNEIAGPYYRAGENRKLHRRCEIYQDVALFQTLYPEEDFMEKAFHRWVDISPESSRNAPDWFRYYLQRAFVETHGVFPEEGRIEDWLDGLLLILRGLKWIGPYKVAYEEWKEQGMSSESFSLFFKDYLSLFFEAVELTGIYWRAVFELYDPPEGTLQIDDRMRARFRRIVQNADLSSPLQREILKDARAALQARVPRKFGPLVRKAQRPINREAILSIKAEDVGRLEKGRAVKG